MEFEDDAVEISEFKPVSGGLCNLVYSNARQLKTKLVSLSPYGPQSWQTSLELYCVE